MKHPILTTCLAGHVTRRRLLIVHICLVFLICTASLPCSSPQLLAAPMRADSVTTFRFPHPCAQPSATVPPPLSSADRLDIAIGQEATPTAPAGIGILALLLALLGWARRQRKP